MRYWGAVLVAGAALLLAAQGAMARPGSHVLPPGHLSEFEVFGSNGYAIDVTAIGGKAAGRRNIKVTATRPEGRRAKSSVTYETHGVVGRGGSVHARLPGVGRIAVRFSSLKPKRFPAPGSCHGGPFVVRIGVFRGTILLRGEEGYTSVRRGRAKGDVLAFPHEQCRSRLAEDKGTPRFLSSDGLFAGAGGVRFSATRIALAPKLPAITSFEAHETRRRSGLEITYSVEVEGKESALSLPDPFGPMEEASVEPPPPFAGSAHFQLTSPTTSTWEGTLSTVLPVLGPVALTGPGWWSALCSDSGCTETAPAGQEFEAPLGTEAAGTGHAR